MPLVEEQVHIIESMDTQSRREERSTSKRIQIQHHQVPRYISRQGQYSPRSRIFFRYSAGDYYKTGEMNIFCSHCNVQYFEAERVMRSSISRSLFSTFCQRRFVLLSSLDNPPDLFTNLLTTNSSEAVHFRENIRFYNNVLDTGSVTVDGVMRGRGSSTFNPVMNPHGRTSYYIGALVPPSGI